MWELQFSRYISFKWKGGQIMYIAVCNANASHHTTHDHICLSVQSFKIKFSMFLDLKKCCNFPNWFIKVQTSAILMCVGGSVFWFVETVHSVISRRLNNGRLIREFQSLLQWILCHRYFHAPFFITLCSLMCNVFRLLANLKCFTVKI